MPIEITWVSSREFSTGLTTAVFALASVAWFFRLPHARKVLFVAGLLMAGSFVWFWRSDGAIAAGLVVLLGAGLFTSTRSKLHFELPVSVRDVRRDHWHYGDNPKAVAAMVFAALGLVLPGCCLLAIGFGLAAVDPDAVPPVRKRSLALASVILGCAETAGWTLAVLSRTH